MPSETEEDSISSLSGGTEFEMGGGVYNEEWRNTEKR